MINLRRTLHVASLRGATAESQKQALLKAKCPDWIGAFFLADQDYLGVGIIMAPCGAAMP
jgi:hypothetical protein